MTSDASLPAGVSVFERGWLSANNILLMDADSAALVDSGYVTHSAQTCELVAAKLGRRRLDLLFNTHLHSDHCGGNAALQALYPRVKTLIPPGQARHVRDWDPVALTYVPTGQSCPQFVMDGLLQPGATWRLAGAQWEVHGAPGHDPHSVILFEPASRTLISADALWRHGFGVVFQELEGDDAFGEVASTLDLIERLAPRVVIPGHGAVFSQVDDALARARARLAGYVRDPLKHATHAAKVLLKFKLLEVQRLEWASLEDWACSTPYFRQVRERWFPHAEMRSWIGDLAADLVRSGAAARDGVWISNA